MNKKRLIYADDIVKVAEHAFNEWNLAMAAADGNREINHVFKMQELCKAVKAVAENAPTVDAVEVVRCKDCKKARPLNRKDPFENMWAEGYVWCMEHGDALFEDDFCSYGERKDNEKR